MPAPTYIQEAETLWDTTTDPITTASMTVLAADVLLALYADGNVDTANDVATISGGSLVWTPRQEVQVVSFCLAGIHTATVDSGKSMTVSLAIANETPTVRRGVSVLTFRGSDGIGASSKTNASGAPSLGITTTGANSAVVVLVADWNAVDGTVRTWRTVNSITPSTGNGLELSYFRDASFYGLYIAYYNDVGAAGLKTVGLTAPVGQEYSIVAVEVLAGSGGGGGGGFVLVAN